MNGLNKLEFLTQAAASLRRVRARTWLIMAPIAAAPAWPGVGR